jgi:hypothetical protein
VSLGRAVFLGALFCAGCSESNGASESADASFDGTAGAGGGGGGASSGWAAVEGSFTEVEQGSGDCATPIADVPRTPWSKGDCYRYDVNAAGTSIQAFDCEGGAAIATAGYSLSNDSRMVSSVTMWTTRAPCVVTRLERELVIQGGQIFVVNRTFNAPVNEQGGQCPKTAPPGAFSCVGMVIYLLK